MSLLLMLSGGASVKGFFIYAFEVAAARFFFTDFNKAIFFIKSAVPCCEKNAAEANAFCIFTCSFNQFFAKPLTAAWLFHEEPLNQRRVIRSGECRRFNERTENHEAAAVLRNKHPFRVFELSVLHESRQSFAGTP